ncbi:hypothetical protein [Lonepinella sp. BR2474]|uniref:hypothetical protein n=1 Tax=Lonepinella sp. BR2474 TaxID=3434548 RepID=UPI003F6DCCDF
MLNKIKQWFKTKQQLINLIQQLERKCRLNNDELELSREWSSKLLQQRVDLQAKLHNQKIQHENKVSGLQKIIENQAQDILQLKAKVEKKKQRYFKKGKK